MKTGLRFAIQSQAGDRSNNEDAAYASPRLLALADGMGGHAAGENEQLGVEQVALKENRYRSFSLRCAATSTAKSRQPLTFVIELLSQLS